MKTLMLLCAVAVGGCYGTHEIETVYEDRYIGCASSWDCDDGRSETTDLCDLDGECHHTSTYPAGCVSDWDCDDGLAESIDNCDPETGYCHHTVSEQPDSSVLGCPPSLFRTTDVPDATPEEPTGSLGDANVLLGSFTVNPDCESIVIYQFLLIDEVSGSDSLADFFSRLWIAYQNGSPIGDPWDTLDDPEDPDTRTAYWFTGTLPPHVEATGHLRVDIYADIREQPTGDLSTVNLSKESLMTVRIHSVGKDFAYNNIETRDLQRVYVDE